MNEKRIVKRFVATIMPKTRTINSFKIFGFFLEYVKYFCEAGVIITFFLNSVKCGFDYGY